MDFKRILIFRIGHLGDTLVSLPAYWAVRKTYPDAELTLLSNTDSNNPQYIAAQDVLPGEELFDKWLDYPSGLSKLKTIKAFQKLLLTIRKNRYDALIYLMTRNRTNSQIRRDEVFFRAAGIKRTYGFRYLKKNIIEVKTPRPLPNLDSELEFLIKCLEYDGFPLDKNAIFFPDLCLNKNERARAAEWLEAECDFPRNQKRLIAVAPASKWSSKVWSEQYFSEVVERLIREKNIFPVIFGGKEDRTKGNYLIEKWGTGANAAGQLNIRQAAAALEECRFYLGNDTGTMHLAASVGTPCVAIFAAVDWPGRWTPFGDKNKTFRRQVECEGCFTPDCFNKNKCLTLIESNEVYRACLEMFGSEE